MAKLVMELPKEVMDEFKWVYENTERIFGGMTKAGAETALGIMLATCPNDVLKSHGKITKTYRTPSDGGINTKAGFWGYIPFHHPPSAKNRQYFTRRARGGVYSTPLGVPADFLVKLYEYGRSDNPFSKKPFVRKAFKSNRVIKAMLEAQKELSNGLLDVDGFTIVKNDPNLPW